MDEIQPVFLLSLQRSGSTLLQRMLASHPEIATTSEPWLLLPLLSALRRNAVVAEYGHRAAVRGVEDFLQEIPEGRPAYLEELHRMTLRLYRRAAGSDATYFLDKTPRYALVLDDLIETFPDAKMIVLWRNPLSVIASIVETWGRGNWNLDDHKIDVYTGLSRLVDTYERRRPQMHAVRYEDLIAAPETVIAAAFRYLEIEPAWDAVERFPEIELQGKMGDPTGVGRYDQVSREPLTKWQATLDNPFRQMWCRRYLEIIGGHRLGVMGYELSALLAELDAVPTSTRMLASDVIRSSRSFVRTLFETGLLREKLRRLPVAHDLHRHF